MIPTDVIRDTRYLPRYDKIQFKKKIVRIAWAANLKVMAWQKKNLKYYCTSESGVREA